MYKATEAEESTLLFLSLLTLLIHKPRYSLLISVCSFYILFIHPQVLGGVVREDVYHNGGEWLHAVFNTGPGLTGFVDAKDMFWDGGSFNGTPYKSVSLGITFNVRNEV